MNVAQEKPIHWLSCHFNVAYFIFFAEHDSDLHGAISIGPFKIDQQIIMYMIKHYPKTTLCIAVLGVIGGFLYFMKRPKN